MSVSSIKMVQGKRKGRSINIYGSTVASRKKCRILNDDLLQNAKRKCTQVTDELYLQCIKGVRCTLDRYIKAVILKWVCKPTP